MTTVVLIPGACHGGWCFDDLADALRSAGLRVLTPTLTGLAERSHLAHRGVNLRTHIDDVLAVLDVEVPTDEPIVLGGHSYGGMVVSGVADAVADRQGGIEAVVYLDAFVPRDGESCWTLTTDEQRAWYVDVDESGFGTPPLPFFDRRATAHPLASFLQRAVLSTDTPAARRRIYVYAQRRPGESPFTATRDRLLDDPAWEVHSLDGAHNLMRDNPDDLARIVLDAVS